MDPRFSRTLGLLSIRATCTRSAVCYSCDGPSQPHRYRRQSVFPLSKRGRRTRHLLAQNKEFFGKTALFASSPHQKTQRHKDREANSRGVDVCHQLLSLTPRSFEWVVHDTLAKSIATACSCIGYSFCSSGNPNLAAG